MSEKLIESLVDIGLSDNEARVYLAGLELGPCTVLQLAKHSGVKRTTIYTVIESLQAVELIKIELYGWKKLFTALKPDNLGTALNRRQKLLTSLIPKLENLQTSKSSRSELSYWEGLKAVKNVYNQLLQTIELGQDYLVLGNQEIWLKLDPVFFQDFMSRRALLNLKIRIIFTDTPTSREFLALQKKLGASIRLLPEGVTMTTNLVITPNQVIINQLLSPPTAIVITNPSIIQTHVQTFELLWQFCNTSKTI